MFLGKIGLSKKAIAYAFLSTVLFTTTLAFVSTAPASAEDWRPVILVGDFTNETKDAKWDTVGIGLAGVIAVKLSHLKCVRVVSEESRRQVMSEQRFGQSGFVDTATAAEAGRFAGATFTVYGSYTLIDRDMTAFAFVADCTTSELKGSCTASSKTDSTGTLVSTIAEGVVDELGVETTETEVQTIQAPDVGRTIDTMALLGEVDRILYYEKGEMKRVISRDQLLHAAELCERVIAVEPNNTKAYNSLGNIWQSELGLGDDDKAIMYYRKALDIDSNCAYAHNNLGNAVKAKGDLDGAIAEYRQALAIDPFYAVAHFNLGNALYWKGDVDGAIDEYRSALEDNPNLLEAHYNLGFALKRKGDLDGAIAEYKTVLSINPNNATAHNNLGVALYDKGDILSAISEYRTALSIDPNDATAHFNLGNALLTKGDLDGAMGEYRKSIAIDPSDPTAYFNLGNTLKAKGDVAGAVAEYEKAVKLDPKLAIAWSGLGICYYEAGDLEQARTCFNKAIKFSSHGSWAYETAQGYLGRM